MARFFASHRLSEHIARRPDGSLVAIAAPIARTGQLEYKADEVPKDLAAGAAAGRVIVYRTAEDLFSPASMASYEGAPLTLGHPDEDEDVTPENWSELAKGHVQNVRRGTGAESDLMLADIVISDAEAIAAVHKGVREISCGYDAGYEVVSPGVGRQTSNRGNHVALVEAGRNGSRVAIRDQKESVVMAKGKGTLASRLRRFLDAEEKAADEEAPAKAADEGEPEKTDVPAATTDDDETLLLLRSVAESLEAIKSALKLGGSETATDEDPDKQDQTADEDTILLEDEGEPTPEAQKTGDRRRTADAATVRGARILAPGLAFREGDSDLATKRAALSMAIRDSAIGGVVKDVLGGAPLRQANPALVSAAFRAAVALRRYTNDVKTKGLAAVRDRGGEDKGGAPLTPADLNKRFAAARKGETR